MSADDVMNFIRDLTEFLEKHGFEITSSEDIDLHANGELIGFWKDGKISQSSFMWVK